VDKARDLIGYIPQTPFEQGLQETVRWFKEKWIPIQASARFGPGTSAAVRGYVEKDQTEKNA
jgi:dTDP-D-glucose 4,6-dehydratase